jgi:predicted ArsR family transcriptional regulator
MAEQARENLHRLLVTLNESRDSRNQRDILNLLKQYPGGLTIRDFCRRMSAYADSIKQSLDVLLDSGNIQEIEHRPTTGRPTKIYTLVS